MTSADHRVRPSFLGVSLSGRQRNVPAIAATLAWTIAPPSGYATEPVVHAGISAPASAWRRAMEAGDLATLTRMHDAATVAFPPTKMKVEGVGAIMKDYDKLFRTYTAHVTFDDARWVQQGPLVVSWGLYRLTLHPKAGGADVVANGRFTDAAVKIDGGWRYLVDHASVPAGK